MKKGRLILWVVIALLLIGGYLFLNPRLPIINGYVSKAACSCTFLADRSMADIEAKDLSFSPIELASPSVDKNKKTGSSSFLGMGHALSEYRPGFGCILIQGEDDYHIQFPDLPEPPDSLFTTYVDYAKISNTKGLDRNKLDEALEKFFTPELETRTVLVIHHDTLVAEQYAEGINKETPQLGWSMTKSVTNALIGILVDQGKLTLDQDHLFPEWENDERSKITLRDLMQMNSGLEWVEDYGSVSDVTKMLYLEQDIFTFLKSKKAEFEPGTHWKYSSGTTNLLMGLIRQTLGDDRSYWRFPHEAFFHKIGMPNAIMETDESGNYIGSSYCFATAREWANFGLLYLKNGKWGNEQILSENWVNFTREPAPHSDGIYGGQFWLNASKKEYPSLPSSLYYADGFQGQRVMIFPEQDMIIVRLGLNSKFDMDPYFKDIFDAVIQ